MSNKISNQSNSHKGQQHANGVTFATNNISNKSNESRTNQLGDQVNNGARTMSQTANTNQDQQTQQQQTNILNVAEMLLHGVADNEILTTWLQSISCQDFASNFLDAGYDMPTISRITPQDLTAIGITDPAKRLKILSEIKKLNLQDGIPAFKPANLSHLLGLLRLESQYFDLLCDQQIDTIEKLCQLTWEDFEELGITRLGHQKRLILAIERMKDIDLDEAKASSKFISEPIYDTNPSQILLVASAENHSMNGPIINKQSSTGELSSSGSGSMHSVYSVNSMQHQTTYASLPIAQHPDQSHNNPIKTAQHVPNHQIIYSQPPQQLIHQVSMSQTSPKVQTPLMPPPAFNQRDQSSHYQANIPLSSNGPPMNTIYDTGNLIKRNTMVPQMNRQSLGQLPFSALANLPKHQQQLLQQRSLYATLGRHHQRVKQPPPPVPVRTNSLKSNSLLDEPFEPQTLTNHISSSQTLSESHANSAGNLSKTGARAISRNQINSQTLLSKNKSFSGNAYMDAARARFLNRNNHYQQPPSNSMTHQMPYSTVRYNQNGLNGFAYSNDVDFNRFNPEVGNPALEGDNMSIYSRQSLTTTASVERSNTFNLRSSDIQAMRAYHQQQHQQQQQQQQLQQQQLQQQQQQQHQRLQQQYQQQQQRYSASIATNLHTPSSASIHAPLSCDEFDPHSDTNSTKSLILQPTSAMNLPISSSRQMSLSQDSDSSQTLYNSASSGSNDRNMNGCNLSHSGDLVSRQSVASNSTLNDVNLIHDQTVIHKQDTLVSKLKPTNLPVESNATTGKDDDFPPPPSPLSLADSEENDVLSRNPDKNFTDINNRLMAFRVG